MVDGILHRLLLALFMERQVILASTLPMLPPLLPLSLSHAVAPLIPTLERLLVPLLVA
jgi:hypothetical protein